MNAELQYLRMFYVWPFVVGSTAFFSARLILAYVQGDIGLERKDIILAGIIGVMGAIVARRISETWIDDGAHWMAFTLGLAFLAVVLCGNALMIAFYDVDEADRRRGGWR